MRIGRPTFTNCDPLYFAFEQGLLTFPEATFVSGTPTALNQKMAAGELDAGPISSIEYARHPGKYYLLPFPCLAATGEVKSITLFSKHPYDQLDGKRLAVTASSATSTALLHILLDYYLGQTVTLVPTPPNLPEMLAQYDGALLIGDEALTAPKNAVPYIYDLGKWWQEYTHAPMVYAVWVVRQAFAKQSPKQVERLSETFQQAHHIAQEEKDALLQSSAQKTRLSPEVLRPYFETIDYTFDEKKQSSLLLFYDYASSNKLSPDCSVLEFFREGKIHPYIGDTRPVHV